MVVKLVAAVHLTVRVVDDYSVAAIVVEESVVVEVVAVKRLVPVVVVML